MNYLMVVQSGNYKQSETNGMRGMHYFFGMRKFPLRTRTSFKIKDQYSKKLHGGEWTIEKRHATTFSLELIFENSQDMIPF